MSLENIESLVSGQARVAGGRRAARGRATAQSGWRRFKNIFDERSTADADDLFAGPSRVSLRREVRVGSVAGVPDFSFQRGSVAWFSAESVPLKRYAVFSVAAPNQALQPTPTAVTPRAVARVAPASGVADL